MHCNTEVLYTSDTEQLNQYTKNETVKELLSIVCIQRNAILNDLPWHEEIGYSEGH